MTIAYTVRVPATSANLGPGFDALGLALSLHDEVFAAATDQPTTVEIAGEGAGELLTDERHLVAHAMRETFSELGKKTPGLHLRCRNSIPQERGLGSSSAAIVAGVTLANAMAGGPLSTDDQLRIAARIEGHPDNVAPCLLGGLTIAWMVSSCARAVSIQPNSTLQPTVFVPANRGLTAQARAALPSTVPHADAAFNAGRCALLVHAMTSDPSLLFDATEDRLHQDYRAASMPLSAELVRLLRSVGVAAVISGAGPSVLALTPPPAGFDPGRRWLSYTLSAETSGVVLEAGSISSTFATRQ